MQKLWLLLWCTIISIPGTYGQQLHQSRLAKQPVLPVRLLEEQPQNDLPGVTIVRNNAPLLATYGKKRTPLKPSKLFQPYFSFGISTGLIHYKGDVYSKFKVGTNLTYGASLYLHFKRWLRVRASVATGSVSGNDSQSPDLDQQAQNLNFRNRIQELSLIAEWDVVPWLATENSKVSGFIFAGFTFFKHNPQVYDEFSGAYLNLRDLFTEGQTNANYSLTSTAIPVGVGGRYNFASRWTVSLQAGVRFTFTDYMDDVGKGNYPSLDALPNTLSKKYSNRTLEPHTSLSALKTGRGVFIYTGTDGNSYSSLQGFEPGTLRGRVAGNDLYFLAQITISTYFGKIPRLLPN